MTEHNILDTIENNKYHSCVILGFSYDPIFFDEVIYPSLKRAGIVNILVFVDYLMLEQSLERVITGNFRKSDGYSLCSIRTKSAFHPKVLQFFGEKTSRTLIGSGNPTFGGYSRNYELWFSFRTENEDMGKSHVVRDVWDYLKRVTIRNGGIIEKKLRMVEDHSSWIKSLKPVGDSFFPFDGNQELMIVSNETTGIYAKLKEVLKDDKIDSISIHSPFYDEKFSILRAFEEELSPKKINIFIQPEYAVIPIGNIKTLSNNIHFFDVDGLFEKQGKSSNRYIHAKLYEFSGKKVTYFLFGSPNLSFNAMGNSQLAGTNEELAIIIRNTEKISYFDDLGLSFEKAQKVGREELAMLIASKKDNKNGDSHRLQYHVTSIDAIRETYEVFIDNSKADTAYALAIQNANGDIVQNLTNYSLRKDKGKEQFVFKGEVGLSANGVLGYLVDKNSSRISNKAVINTIRQLAKSNPSQRYKDIQIALSAIEVETDQLWKLFTLIDPEAFIVKHGEGQIDKIVSSRKKAESSEQNGGAVISYEDFIKVEETLAADKALDYLMGRTSLSEIIDVLNRLLTNTSQQRESSVADIEESDDIEQSDGTTIEHDIETRDEKNYATDWFLSQRKKAFRYFERWRDVLEAKYKLGDALPHHLFALNAISTYLLLYPTLKHYKLENSDSLNSLMPLLDEDGVRDLLNYGLDINGLMYSKLLRQVYFDAKVLKYDASLQREIKYSAFNAITIVCLIATLKLPEDPFYDSVPDMCKVEFLNIMDITRKNAVKLNRQELINHILSFNNIAITGNVDMSEVVSKLESLWSMFKAMTVGKEVLHPSSIHKNKIYYSEQHGFIKVYEIQPINKDTVKLTYSIPGVEWDDEVCNYVSSSRYYYPPAKLYKVNW